MEKLEKLKHNKLFQKVFKKIQKEQSGGANYANALVNKPPNKVSNTSNQKSLNALNLASISASEDFENTVYDMIYGLFLIKPKQGELKRINDNLLLRKYKSILESNVKLFVDVFKYGDLLNEQLNIATYNDLNAYIQQNISLRMKLSNTNNTQGPNNKVVKMRLIIDYFLYYQTPLDTRPESSKLIKHPFEHYKRLLDSLKQQLGKESSVSIITNIVGQPEGNEQPSSLIALLNRSLDGYKDKVDYLIRKIMEWPSDEEIPEINNKLREFKGKYANNIPEELATKLASVFDEYQDYWKGKIDKLIESKSNYNNSPNTRTRDNVYKSRNSATLRKDYEELSNLRLTNKQIYDSLNGTLQLTEKQRKSVRNKMAPRMKLVKDLTQEKKRRMLHTLGFPKLVVRPDKNLILNKYKQKSKELQEAYVYLMSILREGAENITPPLEHYYETGKINNTGQNYNKPQNLNYNKSLLNKRPNQNNKGLGKRNNPNIPKQVQNSSTNLIVRPSSNGTVSLFKNGKLSQTGTQSLQNIISQYGENTIPGIKDLIQPGRYFPELNKKLKNLLINYHPNKSGNKKQGQLLTALRNALKQGSTTTPIARNSKGNQLLIEGPKNNGNNKKRKNGNNGNNGKPGQGNTGQGNPAQANTGLGKPNNGRRQQQVSNAQQQLQEQQQQVSNAQQLQEAQEQLQQQQVQLQEAQEISSEQKNLNSKLNKLNNITNESKKNKLKQIITENPNIPNNVLNELKKYSTQDLELLKQEFRNQEYKGNFLKWRSLQNANASNLKPNGTPKQLNNRLKNIIQKKKSTNPPQ
jgi:predicted peroxiredoxin